MHPLFVASHNYISTLKLFPFILPAFTQIRWRNKIRTRKPRCLPMAPSKVFRIPKHPHVPPDEKELEEELLDEYYRKLDSLRKFFKDEIKQKVDDKDDILILEQKDAEQFKFLLEENRKENERIRVIREKTLEQEFQEKHLEWLQLAEEKKLEQEKTKLKVEEIVRAEKVRQSGYITLENIDQLIEKAIDSPVNFSFTISVDGTIKWEGKPSLEFEADINQRVAKSKESYEINQ